VSAPAHAASHLFNCRSPSAPIAGATIVGVLNPDDETRAINQLVERLMNRFAATPPETVRAVVHASYDEFKGRPIRDFVPVLVERSATEQLVREFWSS